MVPLRWSLLPLLALLTLGPVCRAHGGQYRGAPTPVLNTPGPGGPITPAGALRGPRGPVTGVRSSLGNFNSWQVWWEFNKDPFIRLKEAIHSRGPVSGSDEFYMGNGLGRFRDMLEPTPPDKSEKILPALLRALDGTRNRDIVTACLVAIAKLGIETDEIRLHPIFRAYLPRRDQEIRETATLAMGIAGLPGAEGDLVDLLGDTHNGRRLVQRSEVGDRTRTFAAYALGFLARRSPDVALKERAFQSLSTVLADRSNRSRDLAVGVIHGIGLLDPRPDRHAREKLLQWRCVESLWEYYERDLGQAWQIIQSHVPGAVARLLGRGADSVQERTKKSLVRELGGGASRQNSIYQSAVLALGSMVLPSEEHPADAPYSAALLDYYQDGSDQQARYFSLIALGRIGGAANREKLMEIHAEGRAGTSKPWSAMALGLIAADALEETGFDRKVDRAIGVMLQRDFKAIANPDTRAALAVALGMAGYLESADDLLEQLEEVQLNDYLLGYVCIGLALMDERRAVVPIRDLVSRSVRRPNLLQQAAVSLGKLGDKQVTEFLQDMLGEDGINVARLSAVAVGLGHIGDRRSIDPLIGLLDDDRSFTSLAQAFVAAALGGIGDKDDLPWNSVLATDINYQARVDTMTNGTSGILDIL